QMEVKSVTFEKTGSELIALLKESEEIKQNKPLFNRALRRTLFTHQLISFVDENGYINLKIEKADGRKKAITTFNNYQQAKSELFKITEENQLCQKLTGLYDTKKQCFNYTIKECYGACINKEPVNEYNDRVTTFLEKRSYENQNMLIIDRGREIEERSVILIENGVYKGYGFYNLNYQVNNPEILKSIINPMQNNRDAQHIIQSYLRRKKVLKTVNLSTNKVN
ncbi:MAG: exonuclease, partial [Aequorivita sp.]|nr:exonuclease [Aequorivita sp.]